MSGTMDKCTKCGKEPVDVVVVVPADQSCTGRPRVTTKPIDACIAGIVHALNYQADEPITRGSCCGHGERPGEIVLADGRTLIIKEQQG